MGFFDNGYHDGHCECGAREQQHRFESELERDHFYSGIEWHADGDGDVVERYLYLRLNGVEFRKRDNHNSGEQPGRGDGHADRKLQRRCDVRCGKRERHRSCDAGDVADTVGCGVGFAEQLQLRSGDYGNGDGVRFRRHPDGIGAVDQRIIHLCSAHSLWRYDDVQPVTGAACDWNGHHYGAVCRRFGLRLSERYDPGNGDAIDIFTRSDQPSSD